MFLQSGKCFLSCMLNYSLELHILFRIVSNISCLGHKSIQVCKLQEKRPSAARENPFSSYESSKRAKGWLSAAEIHQQIKSMVIRFLGLSSCPGFSTKGSAHSSGQFWVVRSNWDRWRPVGVSRIGVSGDMEPPILYS
jgi:hypothetical protein